MTAQHVNVRASLDLWEKTARGKHALLIARTGGNAICLQGRVLASQDLAGWTAQSHSAPTTATATANATSTLGNAIVTRTTMAARA